MFLTKLKTAVALSICAGILGTGVGASILAGQVQFTDSTTGQAYPLTGTWLAQVKSSQTASTVLTSFTIDTSLAAQGKLTLSLTGAQTTSLIGPPSVWDLQQTTGGVIKTWLHGQIKASQDITQ